MSDDRICCAQQNLNHMGHENSVCIACGMYWWKGVRYTRKEWAELLEADLERERAESRQHQFQAEVRRIQRGFDPYGLLVMGWPV